MMQPHFHTYLHTHTHTSAEWADGDFTNRTCAFDWDGSYSGEAREVTEGDVTRPGGGCTLTTDGANLCTAAWMYDASSGMMRRLADGWGTVFKVRNSSRSCMHSRGCRCICGIL